MAKQCDNDNRYSQVVLLDSTGQTPQSPATAAKQDTGNTALASILAAMGAAAQPATVVATTFAAVDNTENGQTYATLKGAALHADTEFLRFRTQYSTDNVMVNPTGNASATVGVKIQGMMELTLAQIATAKFFATPNANISFQECKRG